jgi:predicted amino acid dehydrogenase
VPGLRDVAQQAAMAAVERWQDLMERAADVAPTELPEPVQHAAHRLRATTGKVKEAPAVAHEAAERVEELGDRAKAATRGAAEATVETGKGAFAIIFWLGAALGVIFWVLLDEQRRTQVQRFLNEATTQARELARDLKGYDDEF